MAGVLPESVRVAGTLAGFAVLVEVVGRLGEDAGVAVGLERVRVVDPREVLALGDAEVVLHERVDVGPVGRDALLEVVREFVDHQDVRSDLLDDAGGRLRLWVARLLDLRRLQFDDVERGVSRGRRFARRAPDADQRRGGGRCADSFQYVSPWGGSWHTLYSLE